MAKKIRFIGDIHGKYLPYLQLIEQIEESVQVGDFGFGFGSLGQAPFIDKMIGEVPGNHRMIRGNHDSLAEAQFSRHFIKDGTFEDGVMYIGGALSIDAHLRTAGRDWWPDEELSIVELNTLIEQYDKLRPNILVTHECPETFARDAMIPLVGGITGLKSRTRDALDAMYSIRKPEVHIFGHWHKRVDYLWGPTRMICLPELGYIDLEV